jgi:hypothetical protein
MQILNLFRSCMESRLSGKHIIRSSSRDKEFHFQDWISERLRDAGIEYDTLGRNSYPDYVFVRSAEGIEVKGLEWPGREADFDSNSQVPVGRNNGRDIYYVFGRYPKYVTDISEYPVTDLVIAHGNFLNSHNTEHQNKSFRGFGSYGDILIRDRKMYVVPTPFALTTGTAGNITLIVPDSASIKHESLRVAGVLERTEAEHLIIGYEFDLRSNKILPRTMPNPSFGLIHRFVAFQDVHSDSSVSLIKKGA